MCKSIIPVAISTAPYGKQTRSYLSAVLMLRVTSHIVQGRVSSCWWIGCRMALCNSNQTMYIPGICGSGKNAWVTGIVSKKVLSGICLSIH